MGNLIFPDINGEGKEATDIRVSFNVQLSIVMKVGKTGFLTALALLNLL